MVRGMTELNRDVGAPQTADLVAALEEQLAPRRGTLAPSQVWCVFDHAGVSASGGFGPAAAAPLDTAFRIASCTKSFTSATALLLERDGVLDLDAPLDELLGEPLPIAFAGGAPASIPTLADVLAMRAGFATDDPWADRQESLGDDEFGMLLARGIRANRAPGGAYEYSNLGYALAGRALARRAGTPYRELVSERLLDPLGLRSTSFTADVAAPGGAIVGYRATPSGWEEQAFSGPGAFSPIGGLFSTLRDLATWCATLGGRAPAVLPPELAARQCSPQQLIAREGATGSAYGFGLVVRDDGRGRRFLHHSGGYPGFTAHMAWDEASGIGAIAFENATYTNLATPLRAALDEVFSESAAVAVPAVSAVEPWPETRAAALAVRDALAGGELGQAELFDECVWMDAPPAERLTALRALLDQTGAVTPGPIEFDTPASARWELVGARGSLRCSMGMTPLADSRVQWLRIAAVVPGSGLS